MPSPQAFSCLYCKTNKSYHFLFFFVHPLCGRHALLLVFGSCSSACHRLGPQSTASVFCARSFADQTRNLRGLVQIPLAQAAWVESAQLSIQFCLVEIIFVRPNCCRYGTFTTALHVHALHVRVRVWGAHAARAACSGPAV